MVDKIRIDFFDILGYLVPGSTLLIIFWIAADSHVHSVWQIYQSVHSVDKKSIFMGLFLSYILGFSLHILGAFLYYIYVNILSGNKKLPKEGQLSLAEKWTLVRENGEKHIPILERWYALRAFSQNLSAIALICIFISFYKWWISGYFEWIYLSIIFIFAFMVFIKRAESFHKVLLVDMDSVLKKLNLELK